MFIHDKTWINGPAMNLLKSSNRADKAGDPTLPRKSAQERSRKDLLLGGSSKKKPQVSVAAAGVCSPSRKKSCLKDEHKSDPLQSNDENSCSKRVSWKGVNIHFHELRLGDNPSVSGGPPLTIAWEASESLDLSIDEFEDCRTGPPRRQQEMKVPRDLRVEWLNQAGYSKNEQLKVVRSVNKAKQRRSQSAREGQRWDGLRVLVSRR